MPNTASHLVADHDSPASLDAAQPDRAVPHPMPAVVTAPFATARALLPPFDARPLSASAILEVLAGLSTQAEVATIALPDGAERAAVLLLAETARVLGTLLDGPSSGLPPGSLPGSPPGVLPGVPVALGAPSAVQRSDVVAARGGNWRGVDRRSSAAVVRVARMEQWLSARAEDDPAAQPAADLCLWVVDHLDHGPA